MRPRPCLRRACCALHCVLSDEALTRFACPPNPSSSRISPCRRRPARVQDEPSIVPSAIGCYCRLDTAEFVLTMWLINRQRNKGETPAVLPAELLESLKAHSPHSAGLQHLPASTQRLALMPADGSLLVAPAPAAVQHQQLPAPSATPSHPSVAPAPKMSVLDAFADLETLQQPEQPHMPPQPLAPAGFGSAAVPAFATAPQGGQQYGYPQQQPHSMMLGAGGYPLTPAAPSAFAGSSALPMQPSSYQQPAPIAPQASHLPPAAAPMQPTFTSQHALPAAPRGHAEAAHADGADDVSLLRTTMEQAELSAERLKRIEEELQRLVLQPAQIKVAIGDLKLKRDRQERELTESSAKLATLRAEVAQLEVERGALTEQIAQHAHAAKEAEGLIRQQQDEIERLRVEVQRLSMLQNSLPSAPLSLPAAPAPASHPAGLHAMHPGQVGAAHGQPHMSHGPQPAHLPAHPSTLPFTQPQHPPVPPAVAPSPMYSPPKVRRMGCTEHADRPRAGGVRACT